MFGRRKLPRYNAQGKKIRRFPKVSIGKREKVILSVLLFLLIFYVPGILYEKLPQKTKGDDQALLVDKDSISIANEFAKESGADDFDGDGLSNAQEEEQGTDPWNPDTDQDGVFDGAEVKRGTDPLKKEDTLLIELKTEDKKKGKSHDTPFKVNGVIMWANNYKFKAYGGAVSTLSGYRFHEFKGWVQFPRKYCYEVLPNGDHVELKKRKEGNIFYVRNDHEILNTNTKQTMVNKFTFFFLKSIYLKESTVANTLADILPKFGLLSGKRIFLSDTQPDAKKSTKAKIQQINVEDTEKLRFGALKNSLEDLSSVYAQIQKGGCVAVSMLSQRKGESIGIVYGYDKYGNLLVADPTTLKNAGKIYITVRAGKCINKEDKIVQRSWIDFDGFGFHYKEGDQINFFLSQSSAYAKPIKKTNDISDFTGDDIKTRSEPTTTATKEGER